MLLDEKKLKINAGSGCWRRGVAYFKEDRVSLETVSETSVLAEVDGSYPYAVTFQKRGVNWYAGCNCPYNYGGSCKHIVAVGLAANVYYQKHMKAQKNAEQQSLSSLFQIESNRKNKDTEGSQFQLAFNFCDYNFHWRLVPVLRYIKKDGRLGRQTNASSYQVDIENVIGSSIEKVAYRYLENYGYSGAYYRDGLTGSSSDTQMGQILKMLRHSLIFKQDDNQRVYFHPETLTICFNLGAAQDDGGGAFQLSASLYDKNGAVFDVLNESYAPLSQCPIFLLKGHTLYEISNSISKRLLFPFLDMEKLEVKPKDLDEFMTSLYPILNEDGNNVSLPGNISLSVNDEISSKELYLTEIDGTLEIDVKFQYNGAYSINYLDSNKSRIFKNGGAYLHVKRQQKVEKHWAGQLAGFSLATHNGKYHLARKRNPIDWLFEDLPKIAALGFDIFGEDKLDNLKVKRAFPKIITTLSSGLDWFDLEMELDFDGLRVSVEDVLKFFRKKKKYIRLNNGYTVQIDGSILEKIGLHEAFGKKLAEKKNIRRFSRQQLVLVDQILAGSDLGKDDKVFREQVKKLKAFEKIKKQPLPKNFMGQLRDYQKAGYDWLHFLKEYGFGGCLADDMGLGKTAQVLAFIESIKAGAQGKPILVVAPTSVVFNWEREIQKFTPGLKYHLHHGPERLGQLHLLTEAEVVISSYPLLWRDYKQLSTIEFFYIILDESQQIKNPTSLTAKTVYKLRAEQRLVMTGTPIENNLSELWSQFNFLNPGMLGSLKNFQNYFGRAIEKEGDTAKAEKLRKLIYPFILRRKKENVARELPPKVETTVYCEMDKKQQAVYDKWRNYYRAAILKQIDEKGLNRSKMKVLEGLMRLRQISIHPALVEPDNPNATSGKFDALFNNLDEVVSEGHKVLLFSQFVKALALVRTRLDSRKINYAYLDGHTRKRDQQVDKFQNDPECKIFLISLKAGGTGLNLTEASYVFHLDPWWNPAIEMQATDRAHRIGQTRQVFAYKMISRGSVEEKILLLQKKKRKLVDSVISTDATFFKTLAHDDIANLFS